VGSCKPWIKRAEPLHSDKIRPGAPGRLVSRSLGRAINLAQLAAASQTLGVRCAGALIPLVSSA
jgi:hypothetical protein